MRPKKTINMRKAQVLILLLVFMVVAVTVVSSAVIMLLLNSEGVSKMQQGYLAYYTAESGAENAILRLLRDPNYIGETMTIDDATVLITVTGANPKTITSEGNVGNFRRKIQTEVVYNNGIYTIQSWKEIY